MDGEALHDVTHTPLLRPLPEFVVLPSNCAGNTKSKPIKSGFSCSACSAVRCYVKDKKFNHVVVKKKNSQNDQKLLCAHSISITDWG